MFNRARLRIAAVVGMAIGVMTLQPGAPRSDPVGIVANVSKKHKRGLFNGAVLTSSPSLRGISSLRISVAQAKRNASKRINQRRHKRHVKG